MMVYFARHMSATFKDIIIRADDSDVFILLIHHQIHMSPGTTIYMDMGLSSKNNRRCHNITEISKVLGPKVQFSYKFKATLFSLNIFLNDKAVIITMIFKVIEIKKKKKTQKNK